LGYLTEYPELDSKLLETHHRLVHGLLEELAVIEGGLTRVVCHGDTHGFNNHGETDAAGTRKTVFFDFDDAGPGFLAYDLSVLPWSYLFRKGLKEPDEVLRERWTRYLQGYRARGGEVSERDLAALPLFLQLRHLWTSARQPGGCTTGDEFGACGLAAKAGGCVRGVERAGPARLTACPWHSRRSVGSLPSIGLLSVVGAPFDLALDAAAPWLRQLWVWKRSCERKANPFQKDAHAYAPHRLEQRPPSRSEAAAEVERDLVHPYSLAARRQATGPGAIHPCIGQQAARLRPCELRVRDISQGDVIASRAIVMQRKTQRPVQFEIRSGTRSSFCMDLTRSTANQRVSVSR
jgi:hypothetical protein